MNPINRKIIDAVIAKAEQICPDSLALIGIYGSVATGDEYEKSDLDLMILIKDNNGWKLGTGFILEDTQIGYDIYCTNWDGLKWDAGCHHAQLSKLLDSKIVYIKDNEALEILNQLQEQAKSFLQSEDRFERVHELIEKAKIAYANACLYEELGKTRINASDVISSLLDAIMIFHGCYFKRGVKRIFDELSQFPLDTAFLENMRNIPQSKDVSELQKLMKSLILYVENYTLRQKELNKPSADSISGTYEEMYSNWRNKVEEAANADDVFSSFMNMCSLQGMISEVSENTAIGSYNIMADFDADCLENNVKLYDAFLADYEKIYAKTGLRVNRFADVDEFVASYTKTIIE